MIREDPALVVSDEATFARALGWRVVWAVADQAWMIVSPYTWRQTSRKMQWTFKTLEGAWGAAAYHAGYRKTTCKVVPRPGSGRMPTPRKGRHPAG